MILKIRNSFIGKTFSLSMIFVLLFTTINPFYSYGLTGGPAQPEFSSFTPIGTSDMVDLASGDFSYNIPIMDIGGFPINLAYNSGITMDDEASWVGLGWNLSIGQINRQMRGIPDDFDGDQMTYEDNIKNNFTIGLTYNFTPGLFGVNPALPDEFTPGFITYGFTTQYNSYSGFSISPSLGISHQLSENASIGLNIQSSENGLNISPNLSLHSEKNTAKNRENKLGLSVGVPFNSRQGISSVNMKGSFSSNQTNSKNKRTLNVNKSAGSTISFVDNFYTPTVQNNLTTLNFTFNASLGAEFMGVEANQQITAFGSTQFIPNDKKIVNYQAYGYNNNHNATDEGIRDFNREKDGNFSVNTTNLPLTNYTYDIYSVQGQGVSGMFRPYRSQVGYVHDNNVSNSGGGGSAGIELGGGNLFHIGADFEATTTNSQAGNWEFSNNALDYFTSKPTANVHYEEVYFKNVGDLSVDNEFAMYGTFSTKLGEYAPIRLQLGGEKYKRTVEPVHEIKHNTTENAHFISPITGDIKRVQRVKRNQHVLQIKNFEITTLDGKLLGFESNSNAKPHHTAGFIITRNDGARYIYGEALYNTTKQEVTFASKGISGNCETGLLTYTNGDNSINNNRGDKYFNRITTPGYAHTFLLTTLLSADYSDTDDIEGPSQGDLGSYTLFTYTSPQTYKWRVPFQENSANYNEGLRTDRDDDKGSYIYGEKEMRYIEKIETKTHVAIFHISERKDGFGVAGENGGLGSGSKMYKLDKISLYSVGEYYDENGEEITSAIPIKEAHFVYDYYLCQGIPNNNGSSTGDEDYPNQGGKLTLRKVYFTYRNSNMGKYSAYKFNYADTDHDGTISSHEEETRNPDYNLKGYDIWGYYKPNPSTNCGILAPLSVPEFNYVEQYDDNTDDYSAAWSITDIELPSGGIIKIDYESDDYQYVQNKKAMQMYKVAGAGPDADPSEASYFAPTTQTDSEALLFKTNPSGNPEAEYLYIELPEEDVSLTSAEFRLKYLSDIIHNQKNLVQFRFFVNMNTKSGENSNWTDNTSLGEEPRFEYVSGYFELDWAGSTVFTKDSKTYGSVKMKLVDMEGGVYGGNDINPISKASWQFGRKYLSKYIYSALPADPDESDGEEAIVNAIVSAASGLAEIFTGANGLLRSYKIGRRFIPEKSWIRLMNPNGSKKGGGCRVKKLVMTDEWASMTQDEPGGLDATRNQKYGQEYFYDLANGTSSGVATYEPIGAKDNPFVQPVFVNTERLLAPDEENYVEKPFGESFFPNPQVTYSRVTVQNLERVDNISEKVVKTRATGKVTTEFYTSKDYPTITDQTKLEVHEDGNAASNLLQSLLHLKVKKHLTLSQGYVVHTNDMNAKMKSQRVYAEGQDEYISGVDYIYDGFTTTEFGAPDPFTLVSHNEGKINNKVKTLSSSGVISSKTLGVEYDIINDFREMKSETKIAGINANLATFIVGILPIVAPVPLPDFHRHEDKLNMVTTTKVVNTFGILREVVAHDVGASVSTRNLLWDEATGEVLLTETVNEYGDKYYSLNYPAHWYYKGMGMAFLNAGIQFNINEISTGIYKPSNGVSASSYLFNGDEVLLTTYNMFGIPTAKNKAWVDNVGGTFKLIDEEGNTINGYGGKRIKVIRSGRRNMQSASMASVVLMKNPLPFLETSGLTNGFLNSTSWEQNKIVNAGAVEFSENWGLQCECGINNTLIAFNPYRFNTKGVWRAKRSHLYLTGRHHNAGNVDPRNDGFYNTFSPFYKRTGGDNWTIVNTNWTFTSQVSQYSPYGFELENEDALHRFSAAQYGYNFMFPLAVGANTRYSHIGYDGFEDYNFNGCTENEHFGFRDPVAASSGQIVDTHSHTGKHSLKVGAGAVVSKVYHIDCAEEE